MATTLDRQEGAHTVRFARIRASCAQTLESVSPVLTDICRGPPLNVPNVTINAQNVLRIQIEQSLAIVVYQGPLQLALNA